MPSPASRNNDITYIGRTNWEEGRPLFGIKRSDRRQHCYLIGRTGTGKTTVLTTMLLQDIQLGEGVALVDPHGDLAEHVLDYVPARRINDVIYLNPSDLQYPVGFNVLEVRNAAEKPLVASGLVSVFKKLWADSWGPRLEHILRNAILALLDTPGTTLLAVPRFLSDEDYRERILRRVTDPVVLSFWRDEFPSYSKGFRSEALSPILNKVGQFLSSPVIRNIVAQPRSTIDLRAVMDQGKILILNLSKGRIGEDNAALLGAMMITKLQLAAMDRARVPEHMRRDFYVYIDEMQSFIGTKALADILSESRKWRLNLTICHQYSAQLPDSLQAAIFGNVGTLVSFRVGAADAQVLEPELEPQFRRRELVAFPNYTAAIKMTVDGAPRLPFSMTTVRPQTSELYEGHRETITRVSRERYATQRQQLEKRLERWMGTPKAAAA